MRACGLFRHRQRPQSHTYINADCGVCDDWHLAIVSSILLNARDSAYETVVNGIKNQTRINPLDASFRVFRILEIIHTPLTFHAIREQVLASFVTQQFANIFHRIPQRITNEILRKAV